MLYGVDDGARTREQMLKMVDVAYKDGTRFLFLTPHCHPGYFGDNRSRVDEVFRELTAEAEIRWPDLTLILGNELRFGANCTAWLREGICRTLGFSRYVLVDFQENEDAEKITEGIEKVLSSGFRPILAHAERYRNLWRHWEKIRDLREKGALIQMDTQSVLGGFGWRVKRMASRLLKNKLIDFVGSDAHDLERRPPEMSEAYDYVVKNCGSGYADRIFEVNSREMLLPEE